MTPLLLLATAYADAPDDEAVAALASQAFGRALPAKYLCIERPQLPEAVGGDPVPVGVKVKNTGCVLKGVVVEGKWLEPENALIAAVPGWAGLGADARGEVALAWVREVLLAFEQPLSAGTWDGEAVTVDAAWRVPKPQHAAEGSLRIRFAKAGTTSREIIESKTYQTRLLTSPNRVRGLDEAEVTAGLQSMGKLLQECVRQAWADDLTVAGTSRLRWNITGGKTTDVQSVAWGSSELLRCYSGALHRIAWQNDGAVDYTIAISRDRVQE